MGAEKQRPQVLSTIEGTPFATAEEAWFWFVHCQQARLDGVRFGAGRGETPRPCDPDDICREVNRLHRQGRIGRAHLVVLTDFGRQHRAPDPWAGDHPRATILWQQAIAYLAVSLRHKGIVE